MRIIYIHQFFVTNEGAWGTRSYDVCRHLAAKGHEITMIRGISDLSMDAMPWYKLYSKQRIAGFDVITCNVYAANVHNALRRMISYCWFAILATFAACWVRRPDLVFATSLPLTVGIPGYIAARRHRVPFLFEVRDICPEGDVICGYLRKGSLVERLLALLEWFCYLKAERIFLVSPGFEKRLIERGYDGRIMHTILLGADGDLFTDLAGDGEFRKKHGLEGKTVAVYTGAHGTANGLYYVLDAAEKLKDRDDI
ncbi:MAG TPA: glycosyltransferase family 4 protein, partial [Phycisphaerae bacterium]|nr:glycosyltransferase family 4 protein [Phycisphaerae bacterium]